ncbi:MAG: DUF1761 domain-containing protein [Patescibacteria group bacterium]
MPVVPINYVAVLVAGIISMVLGYLWYGPLFGKKWMALMGLSKEKMAGKKSKDMTNQYGLMFVGSLIMAYAFAHSIIFASSYLQATGVSAGLMGGFWTWLGFIAPVTLGSVLWEGKSWKLWMLNNAYYLVLLLINGAMLSVWK